MSRILPRQPLPALFVDTLAGNRWKLSDQRPQHFTLIAFYRGLHCPNCRRWLNQLDQRIERFGERGVQVIAISCDVRERAEEARRDWHLEKVLIGYGLDVETARRWGLYISEAIDDSEPDHFCEPAIYIVQPDGGLYGSFVGSLPFARAHFDEVLKGLEFVIEKDYPPRGEA